MKFFLIKKIFFSNPNFNFIPYIRNKFVFTDINNLFKNIKGRVKKIVRMGLISIGIDPFIAGQHLIKFTRWSWALPGAKPVVVVGIGLFIGGGTYGIMTAVDTTANCYITSDIRLEQIVNAMKYYNSMDEDEDTIQKCKDLYLNCRELDYQKELREFELEKLKGIKDFTTSEDASDLRSYSNEVEPTSDLRLYLNGVEPTSEDIERYIFEFKVSPTDPTPYSTSVEPTSEDIERYLESRRVDMPYTVTGAPFIDSFSVPGDALLSLEDENALYQQGDNFSYGFLPILFYVKKLGSFLLDACNAVVEKELDKIKIFYLFAIVNIIITLFYRYICLPYIRDILTNDHWDLTLGQFVFLQEVMVGIPLIQAIIFIPISVLFFFKIILQIILFKRKKAPSFNSKDSSDE